MRRLCTTALPWRGWWARGEGAGREPRSLSLMFVRCTAAASGRYVALEAEDKARYKTELETATAAREARAGAAAVRGGQRRARGGCMVSIKAENIKNGSRHGTSALR